MYYCSQIFICKFYFSTLIYTKQIYTKGLPQFKLKLYATTAIIFLSDDKLAGGRNEVVLFHMEGQRGSLKKWIF